MFRKNIGWIWCSLDWYNKVLLFSCFYFEFPVTFTKFVVIFNVYLIIIKDCPITFYDQRKNLKRYAYFKCKSKKSDVYKRQVYVCVSRILRVWWWLCWCGARCLYGLLLLVMLQSSSIRLSVHVVQCVCPCLLYTSRQLWFAI